LDDNSPPTTRRPGPVPGRCRPGGTLRRFPARRGGDRTGMQADRAWPGTEAIGRLRPARQHTSCECPLVRPGCQVASGRTPPA